MEETDKDALWEKTLEALECNDYDRAESVATRLSNIGDWRGSSCMGFVIEKKARELPPEMALQIQEFFCEAASWYSLAAEQGEHYAPHYGLAAYYYYGLGGEYDLASAYEHLKHCIEHIPVAKIMMAELHFLGLGAPKDIHMARKLFVSAADAGYPAALANLARLEWSERRPIRALGCYFRALHLAIKLAREDRDRPLLAGVGKRRSFRLDQHLK